MTMPDGSNPGKPVTPPAWSTLLQLPGLAAISLYMLVLAATIAIGAAGGHYPRLFLILPVLFIAAAAGLMKLFRWAWALTLAAVLLLAMYNLYVFMRLHQTPALFQGLLNFVFFLYLVRTEVREKLI